MQVNSLSWKAGAQRNIQLAARDNIQPEQLLSYQLRHCGIQQRLAGIVRTARSRVVPRERSTIAATAGTKCGLVEQIQWGSISAGQLDRIAAADDQVPVRIDARTIGPEV